MREFTKAGSSNVIVVMTVENKWSGMGWKQAVCVEDLLSLLKGLNCSIFHGLQWGMCDVCLR